MNLLDGRVAVLTGGAQGIGLAIAEVFVAHGGSVVIGDVNGASANAAAARIGADRAAGAQCDVVSASDVSALAATARETFGGLDVWVNNAGITRDLKGTWNGIRAAADVMREQKRGSIINLSSISGKIGLPGQTNYSAAKAGVIGMTKAAAKELARHGPRRSLTSASRTAMGMSVTTGSVAAFRPSLVVKGLHPAKIGAQQHTVWEHPDPEHCVDAMPMWRRAVLETDGSHVAFTTRLGAMPTVFTSGIHGQSANCSLVARSSTRVGAHWIPRQRERDSSHAPFTPRKPQQKSSSDVKRHRDDGGP